MGKLKEVYFQWLSEDHNNMTLGIHAQEYKSEYYYKNQVYIGFYFFRFVFEFIK